MISLKIHKNKNLPPMFNGYITFLLIFNLMPLCTLLSMLYLLFNNKIYAPLLKSKIITGDNPK